MSGISKFSQPITYENCALSRHMLREDNMAYPGGEAPSTTVITPALQAALATVPRGKTITIDTQIVPPAASDAIETAKKRFEELLKEISMPGYCFRIGRKDDALWLQAYYFEPDVVSARIEPQYTRKWWLSVHMTKSEFVQTAFKCCLTSYEHRCRESFKYRSKRIFGPHFDVDALVGICGQLDYRDPPRTTDG